MLARDYNLDCSIARTLELVGERWSLLVIRDVFLGNRRFGEMQASLGVARNVLANRLQRLVDEGILERRVYQTRPERHEYFLTEKGLDLWPTLVTLLSFGDKYLTPEGRAPMRIEHKDCGGAVNDRRICERCGEALGVRDCRALPREAAQPA